MSDDAGSNETREPSEWHDAFASLSVSERLEEFLFFVERFARRTFRDVLCRAGDGEVLRPERLGF